MGCYMIGQVNTDKIIKKHLLQMFLIDKVAAGPVIMMTTL